MNSREDHVAAIMDAKRAHEKTRGEDQRPWARKVVRDLLAGVTDPNDQRRRIGAIAQALKEASAAIDEHFTSTKFAALGRQTLVAGPSKYAAAERLFNKVKP